MKEQITENRVMMADSYKYSHVIQYPDETIAMYDYAEARSNKVYDKTVFFGLQYLLKRYFSTPITEKEVQEAYNYSLCHGIPFDYDGWMYIANELTGRLPVNIKAVPEGSVIPTSIPLFTIESTDYKVYWIVSWLETLLMKVWYTSNVATRSYYVKQLLKEYTDETGSGDVDLQYHNFGYRGSSSEEAGRIGGVAHLTQFIGTDNFHSIKTAHDYYNADMKNTGFSIPATEHSSTTSWGKDNEMDMIYNHIIKNEGRFIIAAVMDSYDYYNAVDTVTGTERFRSLIDSDEYPIFVIRPDSGDPKEVINRTLDIMEKNGVPVTVNDKGYKVFNKFRIIWGDGITLDSIKTMLDILKDRNYSSDNIAFGSGGWLMQQHDRDTQGWAIKCSNVTLDFGSPIDNFDGTSSWEPFIQERHVFKDPITAPNKKSKRGKITAAINRNGAIRAITVDECNQPSSEYTEFLIPVFKNGELLKDWSLDEVRENATKYNF